IKPYVTLFHFDLPEDYTAYADLCFKTFGDRVQHWITLNEPEVFAAYGYMMNLSISVDAATFPYIVAHHLILAHASAVKVYRETYQATQKGQLGISLSTQWFLPLDDNSTADIHASHRAWDFLVDVIHNPSI
ncbi:unnamed protein product, partial [Thlaspi arvense]